MSSDFAKAKIAPAQNLGLLLGNMSLMTLLIDAGRRSCRVHQAAVMKLKLTEPVKNRQYSVARFRELKSRQFASGVNALKSSS